jgi:hypothetical protein
MQYIGQEKVAKTNKHHILTPQGGKFDGLSSFIWFHISIWKLIYIFFTVETSLHILTFYLQLNISQHFLEDHGNHISQ